VVRSAGLLLLAGLLLVGCSSDSKTIHGSVSVVDRASRSHLCLTQSDGSSTCMAASAPQVADLRLRIVLTWSTSRPTVGRECSTGS
jgi:uncharacterized protein YcfL